MAAGDITYSNPGGEAAVKAFASGIVSADADTAVNVICGFVPSQIILFYKDTGATTVDRVIQWFAGMTAGYYWNTVMSTGVITLITSNGPTVYGDTSDDVYGAGESATGQGFTVPSALEDADEDTIYWQAWR